MTMYLGLAHEIENGRVDITDRPFFSDDFGLIAPGAYAEWAFMKPILHEILRERFKQDLKWGADADYSHSLDRMNSILVEEVGEVARAINDRNDVNLREELIQVAAVAMKIVEKIDLHNAFDYDGEQSAYDLIREMNALWAKGLVTLDSYSVGDVATALSVDDDDDEECDPPLAMEERGYSLSGYYAKNAPQDVAYEVQQTESTIGWMAKSKESAEVDAPVAVIPEDERSVRSDGKCGGSNGWVCAACFPDGVYVPFGMVREECSPGTFYVGPQRDLMIANETPEQFVADIAIVNEQPEWASDKRKLIDAILYSADTLRKKSV